MRSTFYGLEIAKTGLFTAQNQLDVTGHNMSNSATDGYSRQRIVTTAIPPQTGDFFVAADTKTTAGRGVNAMHIEQVRNPFLDYQYRKENSVATEWTTKEQYFEYVEALFNNELEPMDLTTGLTTTFEDFYNSLFELIENAPDREIRKSVLEGANKLTTSMNIYYDHLIQQQDTLNESIRVSVSEINDIAEQIGTLNTQIYGFETGGAHANDLRDQRNLLIDMLSGIINIDASEDNDGRMLIKIGDKSLVHHGTVTKLAVDKDLRNPIPGESELYGVYWTDGKGAMIGHEVNISSGAIKGYMDIRDGNSSDNVGIPYIVRQLNQLCSATAKKINDVHKTGYTIPDETSIDQNEWKSRDGINFFDDFNQKIEFNMKKITTATKIEWNGPLTREGTFYFDVDMQGNLKVKDDKGNAVDPLTVPVPPQNTLPVTLTGGNQTIDLTAYGLGKLVITGGSTDLAALGQDIQKYCYIDQPINAKNFKVDDEILSNVMNIAVSDMKVKDTTQTNNQMNNAEVGHKLIALIYNKNDTGVADNLNGMFRTLINAVSLEMNHVHTTAASESVMKAHLQEQRLSISAVSLDEEMTNIVRFGHSYSAASRMINAMDEQLDKLINGTGMVGR